jgi:hypothetical protein
MNAALVGPARRTHVDGRFGSAALAVALLFFADACEESVRHDQERSELHEQFSEAHAEPSSNLRAIRDGLERQR